MIDNVLDGARKVAGWTRVRLFGLPVRPLSLTFAVDRGDDDKHVVWVYRDVDGEEEPVKDIHSLLQYGYSEERETADGPAIFVLSEEDRQALLAIKSMNPEIGEDGALRFDFAPPIFRYVRTRKNVAESKASRQLEVSDEPLRPQALVDYEADAGISVETGYGSPDSDELQSREALKRTGDDYALVENVFHPLPEKEDPLVEEWLEISARRLSLDETPAFVKETLPRLKEEFDTMLTDAAAEVRVRERPLQPKAKVAFDPAVGVQAQGGYEVPDASDLQTGDTLETTSDGRYAILGGNEFVPLPEVASEFGRKLLRAGRAEIPLEEVPEFFVRDLALLQKDFDAVLTDLAQQVNVVEEPFEPVVRVDRRKGGWLDFDVGYEAGGALLPHSVFAGASGQDYRQLDNHTWIRVDAAAVRKTERELASLGAEATDDGFRVPVAHFASLEAFIEEIGGRSELSAAYQAFLDQLTGFTPDNEFRLSSAAEARLAEQGITLRPYQRAGIHWLDWLRKNYLHGVLADDMGLGKTIQSIMTMRRAYVATHSRRHSLVLCPKSVMHHWERELRQFFPGMRIERYHGSSRHRLRRSLQRSLQPITFVSTYATVRNDIDEVAQIPFFYVILDEASYIKNPSSKRSKAVKALNSKHRLALTGTPVENRPAEIWSLFDFLMRGHLGGRAQFERNFEEPIIRGNQRASQQLVTRIRPFLLRRKKEEVAKDLPEKIEMDEWCELTREQRQLYGGQQGEVKRLRSALQHGEDVSYTTSILPVLQRLKQICDHPAIVTERYEPILGRSEKFDWIIEKIDAIVEAGEQVVVFSHYLDMLNLLQTMMDQKRIPYMRIDGSTNQRQRLIDGFNHGETSVALLSLMAAGHGITLTGANHVIHADRWWNPAVEDQATDRVHRIGQERTVYVYRILVEGTLEERIDELLKEKRGLSDRIVGEAAAGARRWTREELLEILQPMK